MDSLVQEFMKRNPDIDVEYQQIATGSREMTNIIVMKKIRRKNSTSIIRNCLTFANTWNSFFWPLIVAQSNASITFPVGMGSVMSGFHEGAEAREYGLVMATSVIACLPTVVAFLILQRRFVEGISMSGLKG